MIHVLNDEDKTIFPHQGICMKWIYLRCQFHSRIMNDVGGVGVAVGVLFQ